MLCSSFKYGSISLIQRIIAYTQLKAPIAADLNSLAEVLFYRLFAGFYKSFTGFFLICTLLSV